MCVIFHFREIGENDKITLELLSYRNLEKKYIVYRIDGYRSHFNGFEFCEGTADLFKPHLRKYSVVQGSNSTLHHSRRHSIILQKYHDAVNPS